MTTKTEMLRRLGMMIRRLRTIAQPDMDDERGMDRLDVDLTLLENEHAAYVQEVMAQRLLHHDYSSARPRTRRGARDIR